MIQKDYILRLIQQLSDSIYLLLDKKDIDEDECREQLYNFYAEYVGESENFYLESPIDDIVRFLEKRFGEEEYLYRLEMLSEIMFQDAMFEQSADLKKNKLAKSYLILTYLEEYSGVYSLVREGKKEAIEGELKK